MSLVEKVNELAPEFIGWRRQIHSNPELGFKEFATTQFIMEKLKSWGIDAKPNGDKTGVIGTLKGGLPGTKTVALRCDIDALPMQEKTGLEFASKNDGVCHACGHDLHSASLCGAALRHSILQSCRKGLCAVTDSRKDAHSRYSRGSTGALSPRVGVTALYPEVPRALR